MKILSGIVLLSFLSANLISLSNINTGICYDHNWENQTFHPEYDSINIRLVGNWPFGPAYATAHDPVRNLMFCGAGGGVHILDISNPSSPIQISDKIHCTGYIVDLHYSSNDQTLYVVNRKYGLEIWDVSNTSNPTKLGEYRTVTVNRNFNVVVKGNYAYLTTGPLGDGGLAIIDVSNPGNPNLVYFHDTPGCAEGIFVSGNYAYIADNSYGLRIIDISNPNSPILVGYCYIGSWATDVQIIGNYAYVSGMHYGLYIIDISNPSNPTVISACPTSSNNNCELYVSGDIAYIANGDLFIIDVSDLYNPYFVSVLDIHSSYIRDVYVYDDYAYLSVPYSSRKLEVVDVSLPANPIVVGDFNTHDLAEGIFVLGNYAYISYNNEGLIIVDITDLNKPEFVGNCDFIGSARGIWVSGNYAYIPATLPNFLGCLYIVDVTDPSNPSLISTYNSNFRSYDVCISGNYAFVAAGEKGLKIADISDPYNPVHVNSYNTPNYCLGVSVSGNYAYLADSDALRIIDISDINSLLPAGYYVNSSTVDVDVSGNYAYITHGQYGMVVIDISNPNNPQFAGSWSPTYCWPHAIFVMDNLLYIGGVAALWAINIIDPTNPVEVGCYETPGYCYGIFADNNYVYAACQETGLQIYQFFGVGVEEEPPANNISNQIYLNSPLFSCSDNQASIIWSNLPTQGKIEIYSVNGTLFYQQEFHNCLGSITCDINRIELPIGIYLYKVTDMGQNTLKQGKFGIID